MPADETTIRSTNPLTILLTHKAFILVLRIFLGVMFLYSSLHKIQHPDQFAIAVRAYELMPRELSQLFALFIAWSEAVAGVMLILGVMTQRAAGTILILLVMFTVAILSTMVRGMAIDCGCFSNEGGSQTNTPLIIRNLFLIAAAAMVMVFDRGAWSVTNALAKRRQPAS